MRDYTKVIAWQKSDDLAVAIYANTRGFPREEVYGLTSQIRRSACSVPANIVEGATRESLRDYLHFLYIARGSLSETRYFIHLAGRLGYLDAAAQSALLDQADESLRILAGLVRSVESEAGTLKRLTARSTSALVLLFISLKSLV